MDIVGFLLLGRRLPIELDARTLRELEIVCDIYNKSLILHINLHHHKKAVNKEDYL